MEAPFWIERWARGATAFHKPETNPRLAAHWAEVGASPGARVLVPLCGKSVDLHWLAARGHTVVGVELSPLAVAQFFDEAGVTPAVTERDGLAWHSAGAVTIACGDFFSLRDTFDAAYDRAALIAMPPEMRGRYAEHLTARVRPGGATLLIAAEYEPDPGSGPPFAVYDDEVRARFDAGFEVTRLATHEVLDEEPRFRERGLTAMRERVYRMTRR